MTASLTPLIENISRVVVGKTDAVELALTALLARGHVLIEDAPGLGKTLLARSIAQSLDATFARLQFTPDLLPTDVTGVSVYHPGEQRFEFVPGPVFTQVLLADEINRTSPRTQSSLLEAMEERQVTTEGVTRALPEPFLVIATQNPIELTGTYPLPEAQLDRFLVRIKMGYPTPAEEEQILASHLCREPISELRPVLALDNLGKMQREVLEVHVGVEMRRYIAALANATRNHPHVRLGISPRGSLALMRACQALSYLQGVDYVGPDAVKRLVEPVFGHRLVLDPHREFGGLTAEDVLRDIIASVPVPTGIRGVGSPDDASV